MDVTLFGKQRSGDLVPIAGTDPVRGPWQHVAFVPHPLPDASPDLATRTHRAVADARAALAALDSTARLLPNPQLLRLPTLRTEAQSTSALEGTYAPLDAVLMADEDRPQNADVREVLNYVRAAEQAFATVAQHRSLSVAFVGSLQRTLVAGTRGESLATGSTRDVQVVIGRRTDTPAGAHEVEAARFVPAPPGLDLRARLQDLLDWMSTVHPDVDPVVATALAHYQLETLHPFADGNGRIGRLLVVVHLFLLGTLSEPTLTVSPWFERRRGEYDDRLLAVSTEGDWDAFVDFFARGLEASATATRTKMLALVAVQKDLHERVRTSRLRAETAHGLVDFAVGHPSFSVNSAATALEVQYPRANGLVGQLVSLGVLAPLDPDGAYRRRFYAPEVLRVLLEPLPI